MALRLRKILDEIPLYRPGGCPEECGEPTARKLSSNECPWTPLPEVAEAIMGAVARLNRYPDFYKVELSEALANLYGIQAGQVAIENGSGALLQDIVRIVCDQGDEAVIATPSFAAYEIDILLAGARPVRVPLDRRFTHDLTAMRAAIGEQVRLVLICNPNNPTGTFLTADELHGFLSDIPAEILVVVDEAYREFVTAESQEASLALLDQFENLVLLRTFSKAFGLAGLRLGYCLAAPCVVDAINKTIAEFSVSALAQAAGLACLMPETLVRVRERAAELTVLRETFQSLLVAADTPFIPSQANFVMLLQDSSIGFARMEAGGVICRPFHAPEGIRITIGCEDDMRLVARALGLVWQR
jgi:histidinol-phosphate aminotransferase